MGLFTAHKSIEQVTLQLSKLRDQIFTELDEHREAINADTVELSSQTSRLDILESKLDMLATRLEQLQITTTTCSDQELTNDEQQVFLVLYTSDKFITFHEVALKAGISLHKICTLIASLEAKHIPVEYEASQESYKIRLKPEFKTMQAKHNVVTISDVAKCKTNMRQHVTLDRFETA